MSSTVDSGSGVLDPTAIDDAVRDLDRAERNREQIGLLSDRYPGMTMDDAYAIQEAWIAAKLGRGEVITGWKIGLTSKAMQAALSISIPDSGILLQSMAFANGATIPRGRFIEPRVEAEIAFVTKEALSPDDVSPDAILAATAYVAPMIEILDTRIVRKDPVSGRSRTVCDTISDNAANGGYVLGEPVDVTTGIDLRWIGAIVSRNGEVEETGLGAGVLGDPLISVAWLVERLAKYGQRIEAGQVVLSGSFIRPVEAPSGSEITADFGAFGRVHCSFE